MSCDETRYENNEALAQALAGVLDEVARAAIARRGRALFALAGGSTPLPIYRQWAASGSDFSRVTLVPTDERCVPHDHAACNARALVEAFGLASSPPDIRFITPPDGDPARAAAQAGAVLATLTDPFDAVLLGMGLDGHVASLFPGAQQLSAAMAGDAADALRVDPQPVPAEAPFPRISLSRARLCRSRQRHLVIVGPAKQAVLRRAQEQGADWRNLPVAALLHDADGYLHIHWSPT